MKATKAVLALWLLLVAGLWGAIPAPAAEPGTAPPKALRRAEGDQVDRLIQQLGGKSYAQRQAAYKRLIEIGKPALEALKAAAADKDPERAQRARLALAEVRENIIPPGTYRAKVADFIASSDDAKRQGSWEWMQKRLRRTVPYLLERAGKVAGEQAIRLRRVVFDAWKKEILDQDQKTAFASRSLRVRWRVDPDHAPTGRRIAILDVSGLANMSPDTGSPSSPPWKFLKATWTAELDSDVIARGQTWGSDQTYVRLPGGLKPGRHKLKATVELAEIGARWRWSTSSEAEITVPAKAPPTPGAAPLAPVATIAGRVVDDRGQPAPDVLVTAKSSALGRDLWWGFRAEGRSDRQGRFTLSVPFSDIVYNCVAGSYGVYHRSASVKAIPSHAKGVELVLNPVRDVRVVRGKVTDMLGRPVPNVPLLFVGEYDRTCRAKTDREGRYRVRTGRLGQTVAVVKSGELVAPQQIIRIRGKDADVDVALGSAATLEGLMCNEDRVPIAGGTVLIKPWFANSFRMETRTGDSGRFRMEGIPPGKYCVAAAGPGHFQRLRRGMEYPEVILAAGERKGFDLALALGALVRGKVVDPDGKAVVGAMVATRMLAVPDYREQYAHVRTAADGRFCLLTGRFGHSLPLAAYSSRDGLATAQVRPLQPGQIADGLVLRLPGAASIKGRVTDPEGRPIKDVVCSVEDVYTVSAITGADGRFDLGRITLTARPESPRRIVFRAPRPSSRDPDERQQYYYHQIVSRKVLRDGAAKLDVKLQPTQLLKFSGVVTDGKGAPLAGAGVWLLTGEATGGKWLDVVRPPRSGSIDIRSVASGTCLASTRTGKDGRWTIWTVREDRSAALLVGRETDWTKYCVGIKSKHLRVLVRGIVVPREDPVVALPVKLEEGSPEVQEHAPRAPTTQPGLRS